MDAPEIRFLRTTFLPATSCNEARIRVTGDGFRYITPYGDGLDGPAAHDAAVQRFVEKVGIEGKFQRLPSRDLDHGYRYQLTGSCVVCGSAI